MIYRARLFGAEKMADSGVLFLYVSFLAYFVYLFMIYGYFGFKLKVSCREIDFFGRGFLCRAVSEWKGDEPVCLREEKG